MNLAVNIGNSSLQFAVKGQEGLAFHRVDSDIELTEQALRQILLKLCGSAQFDICTVASVNPKLEERLIPLLSSHVTHMQSLQIDSDFLLDYNAYDVQKLGMDRAVCCEAAALSVPAHVPFLMVDFGTATTVNLVTAEREFLGGMILPGIHMSLEALGQKTAQLPEVLAAENLALIGINTKACMLAGVIRGVALMLENMVLKVWEQLGVTGDVIVTGGSAPWVMPYLNFPFLCKPTLVMEGIFSIQDRKKTSTNNG